MGKRSMDSQGVKSFEFDPIYIDRERYSANLNPQLDQFFIKMRNEKERLKTFGMVQWPLPFISKESLAKAGFFYLLNRDRVQCAFCKGTVCDWEDGDDPLREHLRHFPRCSFLLGHDVGNVPLKKDPIRDEKLLAGHDTCGHYHMGQGPSEEQEHETPQQPRFYNPPTSYESGVIPHHGPRNPPYVSMDSRIRSFDQMQSSFDESGLKPQQLSEAGFYYIGKWVCK